ncbi:MAG: TRAP transporter substrate-binding protein DctP [Opitutaceae bacterium]|nr:TRAP transporter substrate-binding protein DctP [Opitutaceae bacterium]
MNFALKVRFSLFAVLALGAGPAGLSAASAARPAPVEIKLATILPSGTSGHQRLMELRDTWQKDSAQSVKLTVYPGAGDGEIALVRKMRARQLQAVLVSAVGLSQIDRSATCLQIMPLMFRNWREVDYVREKIRGDLEARLRAKDCEVLFWADAGWVRFFSKTPAVRPADFKPMKIFVWAGEPNQLGLMRDMGYQPVGLETEQILPGLSTGMIQAVPVPPFLANSLQFNRYAGHMLELNWVPIVGAAVVRRDTWEKIPAELRARLKQSGEEIGERIRMKSREEDEDAIAAMKKRGLIVHDVPPADLADWRSSVEKAYPRIRGTMVPADLFDQVRAHLVEFRSLQAAAR